MSLKAYKSYFYVKSLCSMIFFIYNFGLNILILGISHVINTILIKRNKQTKLYENDLTEDFSLTRKLNTFP